MTAGQGHSGGQPVDDAERFQVVADRAPLMVWVTDPTGACTYLSRTWYAYTGQTPEIALGFGWLDATHPDDRLRAEQVFVNANERRDPFRLEYRLRRHDGTYRWAMDAAVPQFGEDGSFVGYIGSVVDISESKEAEDALRESESRFRALFTSIDEGYCLCEMILDDEGRAVDYSFLEANPSFESMTGLVDAVGRTAYEMVPDLEHRWVETYARVALDGKAERFEQGSEAMGRWFDVFATPVEPRGRFALVFTDVTERRRADAAQRRAREEAELVADVVSALEEVDGPAARTQRLVELLVPAVADFAWVEAPLAERPVLALAHRDPALGEVLRALRQDHRPPPDPLASALPAATGEERLFEAIPAELVERRSEDPDVGSLVARLATRSHLAVPLEIGGREPAALLLGISDPERRAFNREDLAFVRRIADRAGVVSARARAHEEDHRIAVRLQQTLLPDRLVEVPGVEIAARYRAAGGELEVGGDWYDTFVLPDGRVGAVVGDVVGHGLEAAAAMGRLRIGLSALARHASDPGSLLALLDEFATRTGATDFATVGCVIVDPATGRGEYASAGHPAPLLVAADGSAAWLEEGRSPPLYGRHHPDRAGASFTLDPGALLVMYSDGLVERRTTSLLTRMAKLASAAGAVRTLPLDEVCEQIVGDLGADSDRDDVVILTLRREPAAQR